MKTNELKEKLKEFNLIVLNKPGKKGLYEYKDLLIVNSDKDIVCRINKLGTNYEHFMFNENRCFYKKNYDVLKYIYEYLNTPLEEREIKKFEVKILDKYLRIDDGDYKFQFTLQELYNLNFIHLNDEWFLKVELEEVNELT